MAHSIGELSETSLSGSDGHVRDVVEESDMNPPKLSLLQTEMKVMAHAAADAQRIGSRGDVEQAPGDVMNKVSNILLEDALELRQLLHPQGSSADEIILEQDSPESAFDATRREIARFLSEDQRRLTDGVVTKIDPTQLLAVHKLTGGLAAASRADTDPAPVPAADPAPTSAPTSKKTKSLKDFYGEVTPVVGSVLWVCIFLSATCCCMVCCWGLLGSVLFGSYSQAKEDGQVDDELDGLHEVWVRSKGKSSARST
jgi:hypothetical protein